MLIAGDKLGEWVDTKWDIDAEHASLQMSIDIHRYINHKCTFYTPMPCHSFMTQDMGIGWENILFYPGRFRLATIKKVLLQHQKQTKKSPVPGAETGVGCCSIALINFGWKSPNKFPGVTFLELQQKFELLTRILHLSNILRLGSRKTIG